MHSRLHTAVYSHKQPVCASLQMRRAPGCTELIYMFDGDRNGVCWHLGTCGGTQPWVNPVLAGILQVGWQLCPRSPQWEGCFAFARLIVYRLRRLHSGGGLGGAVICKAGIMWGGGQTLRCSRTCWLSWVGASLAHRQCVLLALPPARP